MKRLLAAAAACAVVAAASTSSAFAAGAPSYGSVKLNWSVNTSATMLIVTQYSTFTQGTGTPALLPSVAGVCAGSGSETNFNVSFGAQNPSLVNPTACLYQNAVAASVTTNDATGFKLYEYLDAAPAAGIAFCAWPNGGAAFPVTAGAISVSGRSGNPAAGTYSGGALTACAAGASQVPIAAGGTLNNGGGGPGNPGGTEENYSGSTSQLQIGTYGTTAAAAVYVGQDLQLNMAPGQASSAAASSIMTLALVPN